MISRSLGRSVPAAPVYSIEVGRRGTVDFTAEEADSIELIIESG